MTEPGWTDEERLDWLEKNLDIAGPDDQGWECRQIPGSKHNKYFIQGQLWAFDPEPCLRSAIDAAMESQEA